ncbi:MAG: NAD(+)/NADH kinase [candidate division Zixibacteria bacterium]|nr:NAD(+)/NADH kinase [candidate division Zixibacteria bacterium]
MKRFGIIVNIEKPQTKEAVLRIIKWVDGKNYSCYLEEQLKEIIGTDHEFLPRNELCEKSDYVISLGGDGTMLATVRSAVDISVPILGINLGSLGFLTQQPEKALINSLERIDSGDYQIDERMVLIAETDPPVDNNILFALNDMVIDRGALSRLITLNVKSKNEFVSSYRADGLIISTPTGSTAYNLAAGGPIVYPSMDAIVLCPICTHTLTQRPLILPGSFELTINIESTNTGASLTVDGQKAYTLNDGHMVKIRAADHRVNLIKFSDNSFFGVLRKKLYLGRWPKTGI